LIASSNAPFARQDSACCHALQHWLNGLGGGHFGGAMSGGHFGRRAEQQRYGNYRGWGAP
jgi:hypothetical protein